MRDVQFALWVEEAVKNGFHALPVLILIALVIYLVD